MEKRKERNLVNKINFEATRTMRKEKCTQEYQYPHHINSFNGSRMKWTSNRTEPEPKDAVKRAYTYFNVKSSRRFLSSSWSSAKLVLLLVTENVSCREIKNLYNRNLVVCILYSLVESCCSCCRRMADGSTVSLVLRMV